jgi:hypothetical protein
MKTKTYMQVMPAQSLGRAPPGAQDRCLIHTVHT